MSIVLKLLLRASFPFDETQALTVLWKEKRQRQRQRTEEMVPMDGTDVSVRTPHPKQAFSRETVFNVCIFLLAARPACDSDSQV